MSSLSPHLFSLNAVTPRLVLTSADTSPQIMHALQLPSFHLSNLRTANSSNMASIMEGVSKDASGPQTTPNHYGFVAVPPNASTTNTNHDTKC